MQGIITGGGVRMRIVGKGFRDAPVAMALEEYEDSSDGTSRCERTLRTYHNGWREQVPSRGAVHPVYTNLVLTRRKMKQLTCGFLCDVTMFYERLRSGAGAGGGIETGEGSTAFAPPPDSALPPPRYAETNSQVEIAIEAHPRYAELTTTQRQAIEIALRDKTDPDLDGRALELYLFLLKGTTNYITGSVLAQETTYSWGRPPSLRDVVGQLSGDKHWLTVSGAMQQEGICWSRTISRLFSATEWPPELYGAGGDDDE